LGATSSASAINEQPERAGREIDLDRLVDAAELDVGPSDPAGGAVGPRGQEDAEPASVVAVDQQRPGRSERGGGRQDLRRRVVAGSGEDRKIGA
jgi:hypothetical protein